MLASNLVSCLSSLVSCFSGMIRAVHIPINTRLLSYISAYGWIMIFDLKEVMVTYVHAPLLLRRESPFAPATYTNKLPTYASQTKRAELYKKDNNYPLSEPQAAFWKERPSRRGPPSVRGRASFTVNLRPPISLPFIAAIAALPSSSLAISAKPKPLDLPLSLSIITDAEVTVPNSENSFCSSSFVVENGKFPT